MNILHTIILGLVEGVTEFLPISSTAHLILMSKFLGLTQNSFVTTFEVAIQSGAILAVIFIYGKKLLKNTKLVKLVIVSFIPTAIIGLLLHDVIKNVFFKSDNLILVMIGFVGLLFIGLEYYYKKNNIELSKEESALSYRDALMIGIFQSLAVVPGVSRAGAVIVCMMLLRYRRKFSAEYSFLLAIPTILAATALDLVKFNGYFTSTRLMYFGVGFVTAFISALFIVKWFTLYLEKNNLIIFGFYRILLALGFFFFL
jgi:undecaprenyl-diphosphatase